MDIKCSFAKMVDPQTLILHDKNPNHHSKEQIDRLAKLIKFQGARHPIIVSRKSGKIVAGHGRLMAMRQLGWKQVPVDYQDFKSNEEEYAFLVSDNAISEWADLDLSAINHEVLNLPDFDIDLLGIEDFKIVEPVVVQCDEDEVPEQIPTVSVLGDLYELGEHRLLCGDSTSIDAVEKLMNGKKADMVFTDPPYGISFSNNSLPRKDFKGVREGLITNDYAILKNDNLELNMNEILSPFEYVKEIFVWGAQNFVNVLPVSTWFCWDRKLNESADKNLCGDFDLCWSKQKHKMKMYRSPWYGVFGHSKTDDGHKKVHPTMKPVALIKMFLDDYSKQSDSITDLFGGSGSTLIACEKTKRKCFMMELDPHYVDVIVSRYVKYTGNNKIKRNGEEIEWQI